MSFRHKSSLSRHNKIHLKNTQCVHCNRTFRYESFLKKHLLTAHKELSNIKHEIKSEQDVIDVIPYDTGPQFVQIEAGTHYYQGRPVQIQIQQAYSL